MVEVDMFPPQSTSMEKGVREMAVNAGGLLGTIEKH